MKAILTGHTRGLGAAIAEELLSRNIPVLGLARKTHPTLAKRYPGLLDEVALDLGDTDAVVRWFESGRLDAFLADGAAILLINNAGVLHPVGPIETQDAGEIGRAVSVNVAAPLMLSSAVAARRRGDLRILHVSSGAGRSAYAGWSVYCATKAALDHHARAVALDGTSRLKICSLAPGVIDTDMQAEIRTIPEQYFPQLKHFVAMKRDGDLSLPGETAARVVAYLLSERFGTAATADLRELPET